MEDFGLGNLKEQIAGWFSWFGPAQKKIGEALTPISESIERSLDNGIFAWLANTFGGGNYFFSDWFKPAHVTAYKTMMANLDTGNPNQLSAFDKESAKAMATLDLPDAVSEKLTTDLKTIATHYVQDQYGIKNWGINLDIQKAFSGLFAEKGPHAQMVDAIADALIRTGTPVAKAREKAAMVATTLIGASPSEFDLQHNLSAQLDNAATGNRFTGLAGMLLGTIHAANNLPQGTGSTTPIAVTAFTIPDEKITALKAAPNLATAAATGPTLNSLATDGFAADGLAFPWITSATGVQLITPPTPGIPVDPAYNLGS